MRYHILARALLASVVFLLSLGCVWSASAQSIPVKSTNLSGSITTTNTFQSIQGQTNNRNGCLIQNNGTHTMYVYFGAMTNATTSNSVQLSVGQSVSCAINGDLVVQDAISITGTSGDTFFANFQ
jgi:hypothetical protein